MRRPHRLSAGLVALSLFCVPAAGSQARDATEPFLKAAFIYNFVKFVQWPADAMPGSSPLQFCVADSAVADALESITGGRSIDGHPLVIWRVKPEGALNGCQVLYLGGSAAGRAAEILRALRVSPVLTVGDLPEFALKGGIVHLIEEGGRIRFIVNLQSARGARVCISAKLLSLALLVRDAPHGPRH